MPNRNNPFAKATRQLKKQAANKLKAQESPAPEPSSVVEQDEEEAPPKPPYIEDRLAEVERKLITLMAWASMQKPPQEHTCTCCRCHNSEPVWRGSDRA